MAPLVVAAVRPIFAMGARDMERSSGDAGTARDQLTLHITQRVLRLMQVDAPPLMPLLRSRLQAELLTLVLLSPGREWTLTELAGRVGSSVATAQREVTPAEETGVITSRRLGSTRLVTAATSPLTEPLTELMLRSFGPRQVVAEELADLPGIDFAFLFGSWAARYEGQHGDHRPTSTSWSSVHPTATIWTTRRNVPPPDWPARST
jgi:hypothetical protein